MARLGRWEMNEGGDVYISSLPFFHEHRPFVAVKNDIH
jgi:hypothetical protein